MFQWMDSGQSGQIGAHAVYHVTMVLGHDHVRAQILHLLMAANNVQEKAQIQVFATYARVQVI